MPTYLYIPNLGYDMITEEKILCTVYYYSGATYNNLQVFLVIDTCGQWNDLKPHFTFPSHVLYLETRVLTTELTPVFWLSLLADL